ncbi:hypothetical protein LTR86_011027 [Recurvomyces mirabilis]|nr:hypothetical protein LTR86_011027 [Recurvomyces mirabilis]
MDVGPKLSQIETGRICYSGISEATIERARNCLREAPIADWFAQHPEQPSWAAGLDVRERLDILKDIIETWTDNPLHLSMVARMLTNAVPPASDGLEGQKVQLKMYVAARTSSRDQIYHLKDGIRRNEAEVVVIIPTETWGVENGFFIKDLEMKAGQYICLKGNEPITIHGVDAVHLVIFSFVLSPTSPESSQA